MKINRPGNYHTDRYYKIRTEKAFKGGYITSEEKAAIIKGDMQLDEKGLTNLDYFESHILMFCSEPLYPGRAEDVRINQLLGNINPTKES